MSHAGRNQLGAAGSPSVNRRRLALDAIFAPRSLAIIGATDRPGSVGLALMQNLRSFPGETFLVNSRRPEIGGQTTYPRISAIPRSVDVAVIATPASSVPEVLHECAAANVPAAIIISAGFRECGAAGAALEQQCLAEARRGKMRLVGPNCLGLMIPHQGLNATFARDMAQPGGVAFLSQSGALCTAVLDWSLRQNVGFSAFVSVGSMLDVGWGDLITHFGDDPQTKSIVCYLESVGDARRFLSAAREVALTKPIVALKVGRTSAAAKAAASHTGALTGSDAVLDAAFRRVGVLRVDEISELFDMAEVLSKQPRSRGRRLAIVTNAGGPGALATDALVASGGELASLSAESTSALDGFLPSHWSHGNPIDILGDADGATYARATELTLRDPQVDGVLVVLTPQAMTDATETAKQVSTVAKTAEKPLLASWMGAAGVEAGESILNQAGIPTFPYPDHAARAFALLCRHSESLQRLYETPTLVSAPSVSVRGERPGSRSSSERAHDLISAVRQDRRTLLTEVESKQLLAAYGIPTVETRVALNAEEAVQCAEKLGMPVALKLLSKTLTHKTDVGGVCLDLRSAAAVRQAWDDILQSVTARAGREHFLGVTVQPMIPRDGYELVLGSSLDPQFGPVLLFGAGGQLVEVFQDTALELPPLNANLARRWMERTKIFAALQGVRGRKSVDLAALEQLVVQFSQLVAEQRWIAELDINPLLVSSDRLVALDSRVILHPADTAEGCLPRLAIRPYPHRYEMPCPLRGGEFGSIRPIRPEDEPLLVKFHQTLSERSVYLRYFAPLKLDQRIAHERLSRMCFIDYDREMVLVAQRGDLSRGDAEILGVVRLTKLHDANEAEFALIVADGWQGCGLGSRLLQAILQAARDEKLGRVTATIHCDNPVMRHVARKAGFAVEQIPGAAEYLAQIDL